MKYIIIFIIVMTLSSCGAATRKDQIYEILNSRENASELSLDDAERDKQFQQIATLYGDLSKNERMELKNTVSGMNAMLIQIIDMYCDKWETIMAGWSHEIQYYQSIRLSVAISLPRDGAQHVFKINWDNGRPQVNLVPEIPGDRGESSWYGCGIILPNGELEAFYIFSDMGHAGVWGVIITPRNLKEDEDLSRDEMIGWVFVRIGKRIHPGFYEAENNLD